jgi:hypothetical protein
LLLANRRCSTSPLSPTPRERGPQVVDRAFGLGEAPPGGIEELSERVCPGRVVVAVACPRRGGFAGVAEPFLRVLVDTFQQPVPGAIIFNTKGLPGGAPLERCVYG